MPLTKRLILIRHAKSGWDDPLADDHERVLTERGHRAAASIGSWLTEQGFVPDLLLSSDAQRTAQTSAHIMDALPQRPNIRFVPQLYHAAPDAIITWVRKQAVNVLALVGHNPGIAMAADGLLRNRPAHNRFADYPTCATTVIDFDIDDWRDMQHGTGHCTAFTTPHDLITK